METTHRKEPNAFEERPLLKSGFLNVAPPVVTSLAILCHLHASILGREVTDLTGRCGENKWSSCAFLPLKSELDGRCAGWKLCLLHMPSLIQQYCDQGAGLPNSGT